MLAAEAKKLEIEPDPYFFMTDESFGGKCDWRNVRSYLFFNVQMFRIKNSAFDLWPSKSHLKQAEFIIMLFRTSQKNVQGSMC